VRNEGFLEEMRSWIRKPVHLSPEEFSDTCTGRKVVRPPAIASKWTTKKYSFGIDLDHSGKAVGKTPPYDLLQQFCSGIDVTGNR
jgi:hypothetical protein